MKNHRNEIRGVIQKTVMLSIIIFISVVSKAQLTQNKVVEFVINGDINDEYNLAPLKKDGLLIINPQSSYYGRDSKVNFMKLDTSLNFIWKSTYKVALGYKLEKYFQNEKFVYSLFRETDRLNISVVRVDYATGDRVVTDTKLLTKMDIGYFTVVGSKAIIGGTYNDRPVVEMISLFDQTAKVLPQLHTNHMRINSIEVNEANALIYVMLSDQRNCKFTLSIYDYEGRAINSKILGEKNKVIINGKLLTLPDNQLILAGNFADNCTNYSSGFYLYPLLNDQKIKYFDFADLDNFFSYLSEKKQKKIRTKMLARKERGKENKVRHRLLLHDIQTDKQGITFTAEVYYPEYKSTPNLSLNSIRTLGLNTPSNSSYNNYRFTHAIICDFDFNGNLKWDYSIGLNNLESTFLEEKVQLTKIDDKYLLAFPDENLIKTELVARNRKDKESYNLDLKQNSKKNSDDFSSELSSWYANTFVAYGMKTTRAEGGLNTKDVFYLSKLSYNPVDSKKLLD